MEEKMKRLESLTQKGRSQFNFLFNNKGESGLNFYFWQNCVLAGVCFVYMMTYLDLPQEKQESSCLLFAFSLFVFSLPACAVSALMLRMFSPLVDASLLVRESFPFKILLWLGQGSCVLGLMSMLTYFAWWYPVLFLFSALLSLFVTGRCLNWMKLVHPDDN
ncbi:MAG: hypothetical protein ACRCWR_10150 [Saezia sp.]